jgi:hypothetical protein
LIPANSSVSVLLNVDGADRGVCVPSLDPPLEELKMVWSAHVDSYSVVRVVIRNESDKSLLVRGTLRVLNIEY